MRGDRAAILRRWFDLMVANADDLGALMTAEQESRLRKQQAKPFMRHLRGMVRGGSQTCLWRYHSFADHGQAHYLILKQPIGVCAAITPWNFRPR